MSSKEVYETNALSNSSFPTHKLYVRQDVAPFSD